MMVAMNPQTFAQDIAAIEPGGYLFYDSSRPMPASALRDDMTVIGMPLTEICTAEYADPRQRQLYKNIVYVGALAALLDIDLTVVETLVAETVQGQGAPDRGQPAGAAHRLRRGEGALRLPARHPRAPQRRRRRPHSGRRQFRRRPRRGLWRGDGLRLVSDHAFDLARRGVRAQLRPLPRRSGDGREELRHRPGRGRDRGDRHGRSAPAGTARAPSPRRPGRAFR